jgi:hypothetical protein
MRRTKALLAVVAAVAMMVMATPAMAKLDIRAGDIELADG